MGLLSVFFNGIYLKATFSLSICRGAIVMGGAGRVTGDQYKNKKPCFKEPVYGGVRADGYHDRFEMDEPVEYQFSHDSLGWNQEYERVPQASRGEGGLAAGKETLHTAIFFVTQKEQYQNVHRKFSFSIKKGQLSAIL